MKKVLFVFVAVISMLTMTSCVDKEQCVGKWESENVSEEGFTGNFYLDLNENGTANLGSPDKLGGKILNFPEIVIPLCHE